MHLHRVYPSVVSHRLVVVTTSLSKLGIFKMKVLVTGGSGLVGQAMKRYASTTSHDWLFPTSTELDLTDRVAVMDYFSSVQPQVVVHLASKCGGIALHTKHKVEFFRDNVRMNENVFEACYRTGVSKTIVCLSSVVLRENVNQPLDTSYGRSYYYSKLMALLEIENYNTQYGTKFIPLIVPNLYGVGDRTDPEIAHVVPALISKITKAHRDGVSTIRMHGSPWEARYFMNSYDVATTIGWMIEHYDSTAPLVSAPPEPTYIGELVETIANVVGYTGMITFENQHRPPVSKLPTERFIGLCPSFEFTVLTDGIREIVKTEHLDSI